ncbi:hypothetical protein CEXT_642061 [Caerostris extrusa]|uniref:Uncharacterized protein n=1 Tax=Caerostris extrusa TaxID=172846 RepID=A0AAV4XTH0_CAEEX|nr:hypothetical protein CEXT_642061 [Caerostris extrusa]
MPPPGFEPEGTKGHKGHIVSQLAIKPAGKQEAYSSKVANVRCQRINRIEYQRNRESTILNSYENTLILITHEGNQEVYSTKAMDEMPKNNSYCFKLTLNLCL